MSCTILALVDYTKCLHRLAMSSDNTSSAVTYTSISSDLNGLSWGIPLVNVGELPEMDPYEEIAQQGHVMYKGLKTKQKRRVLSPLRHVSSHVLPRGTTWLPRGSAVVRRWSAAVERRWPPLTTVDRWSDGDSGDGAGTVDKTRGTNHRVTRGHLIIRYEVLFIVCMSEVWSPRQSLVYEVRQIQGSRMGYVAQGD
ncbi:hypothetical protein Tco_1018514 [Tanacetum coccineum]|uniref:Uncharacterized protein n=1 Tax=Tanacetum coccineum TaxID=301880 RepID=A0ABQ5FV18_9ASTR